MKYRNLAALRRQDRQAGIGITIQKDGIGLLRCHDCVAFLNDPCNGLCRTGTRRIQEMIGLADFKLIKKNLIQLMVEVLPRMDQQMYGVLFEFRDHTAHLDQLGPSSDDCHDLEHSASNS